MTNATKEALRGDAVPVQKDRYRVNRGEPGANVVTPLRDGYPVIENPPMVPDILSEEKKPSILSPQDEKAHYYYDLIRAIDGMISSRGKVKKGTIIDQSLLAYNSGIFLPTIHKKLGSISRSKFYELWEIFKDGDVENLAPKKGRKDKSKITEDEKNCLLTILRHQNHIKIGSAIRVMKYFFTQKKIPSPSSERTLRRYIDQFQKEHNDLWTLWRQGEKALNDKVLPYIERDRTLIEVGDGLVADGHRLNLDVINPFTGRPCRAIIIVFLDWRSNYPLGWEIMLEESVQCIASALRNSILTLGKIPKWLYIDNGKAFKSKVFNSPIEFEEAGISGMFARLGINVHFSQPYNAQAKISERFWRTFTDWFERLMDPFRGSGIEDKPAYLKRNEKLARSMHNPRVPTVQELSHYIDEWREFYIDQPSDGLDGKTPQEIFEPGRGPGVNPGELAFLMMPMEIKTIYRNGVKLFGYWWFNEELYGLRDQVIIRYSLFDLSQIYCFYENEFLCILTPREKAHPMASEGGTPKDMEHVKRMIAQKRSLKRQTIRLCKILGTKQDLLPWKEIIQEVPNVIETIENIEAEKPASRTISPFVDGVIYSEGWEGERPIRISSFLDAPIDSEFDIARGTDPLAAEEEPCEDKPKYKLPKDWSNFKGEWWERYDYHMAQDPASLNQEDLEFIDWYKTTSEYKAIYEVKPGRILSGG